MRFRHRLALLVLVDPTCQQRVHPPALLYCSLLLPDPGEMRLEGVAELEVDLHAQRLHSGMVQAQEADQQLVHRAVHVGRTER